MEKVEVLWQYGKTWNITYMFIKTERDSQEGLDKDIGMENLFLDIEGLRRLKMSLEKNLWLHEENEQDNRQR